MKSARSVFFTGAFCLFQILTAHAVEAASFKVEYGASLMGIPVGKLEISGAFRPKDYEIQSTGRLAGLAGVVASGKGAVAVTGSFGAGQVSSVFDGMFRLGKSSKAVRIELVGGKVAAASMEPPMDERPGRIPVLDEHKRNVIDPLTAMVMSVEGQELGASGCDRILPIFDGGSRFDLVMSFAEKRQVDLGQYKGPVLVCNVRFVPISGHRPSRSMIKYMQENKDMSVWLAPIAGTQFVFPLRISVRTLFGTGILEAEKWSVDAAGG